MKSSDLEPPSNGVIALPNGDKKEKQTEASKPEARCYLGTRIRPGRKGADPTGVRTAAPGLPREEKRSEALKIGGVSPSTGPTLVLKISRLESFFLIR